VTKQWDYRVGQEVELASWEECVTLLAAGDGNTIYRGHGCFEWELQSTLERALLRYAEQWDQHKYDVMRSMAADTETEQWTIDVERTLTDYFRRNAVRFRVPHLPATWDTLGWWEVMQHHRAPTRLMDWSSSPLIAVWFALDGHQDGAGDMALWVYDRRNALINHADALATLGDTEGGEQLEDRRLMNRFVRAAMKDGNPVLIPVQPRSFPRAVAQQSVLTVSPSIDVGRPAHWWIRQRLATRVRLREDWKPDMTAACRTLGLSRPSLLRDLDSLGDYVFRSFVDRSDLTDWIL
jgi:hypothetical protein